MKVFIDTCSNDDFHKVVRFLSSKNIDVSNRDIERGEIQADITPDLVEQIKELPLDNTVFIGTSSLWSS